MRVPNFMLKQNATIYKSMGAGAYGHVYSDTPTFSKVYVEPSTKVMKNSNGEEVVTTAMAIFPPRTDLPLKSKVLIDGYEYLVVSVVPVKSWTDSCMEVMLS